VPGKIVRRIAAVAHDRGPGRRVDYGTGCIGIAVASVGARGQECETNASIALRLQRVRRGKRQIGRASCRERV